MSNLDMTDGIYRRIYSGFISHPKINALSWMAEAWFWRLVVLADDYGNHSANWRLLAAIASPVRDISTAEAKALTEECIAQSLVTLYDHEGQPYLNISGFTKRQPANKNGRRIQRFPMNGPVPTGESGGILVNPGESKGIRVNPGESGGIRGNPVPPIPTPLPIPNPTPTPTSTPSDPTPTDGIGPRPMTMDERQQVRQGLIRIGVDSGAAQQVALHPLLTLAMVTSNMKAVKKSKGVKSQAAVLLTRLRRELEIAE
jgi:hypothetical protein